MSQETNYFRIGIFILVAIAILAGGLIIFGVGKFFEPRIYMETYVNTTVQGVEVGSPVKFRGVMIGRVQSVGFTMMEYEGKKQSNYYNYVVLGMEITKEVFPDMFEENLTPLLEKAIAKGLRMRIEPLGITGMSYIEMDYVDPKQFPVLSIDWTPRTYYVPSAPGQLTNILDSVNSMMRDIESFNLGGIAEKTNDLLDNLNQAITGAQFGKLSSDMQSLIADLKKAIAEAQVAELSADTKTLLQSSSEAAKKLEAIMQNVEPVSRMGAKDLQATLDNLRVITENLTAFSAAVRQNPARLIWGGGGSKPDEGGWESTKPEKRKPQVKPTPMSRG